MSTVLITQEMFKNMNFDAQTSANNKVSTYWAGCNMQRLL